MIKFEPFTILLHIILFFGSLTICFKIIMRKGIGRIYKHIHRNWSYPSPNTTFVLPEHPESSIQTQLTRACDYYVGSHSLASAVSYQRISITLIPTSTIIIVNSNLELLGKIIAVLPLLVIQSPKLTHQINPNFLQLKNITFVFK